LQPHAFDAAYLERLRAGDPATERHFAEYFGALVRLKLRRRLRSAHLIEDTEALDLGWVCGARRIGVSAGASAPEVLVEEIVEAFKARFAAHVESVVTAEEDIAFKLPRQLRDGPSL